MPDRPGAPPRAWQRMLSGRRLDLLNPTPMDVEIADIAHGLARVPRWNGQTVGPHAFSVAQHSLMVEALAGGMEPDLGARWRLAVLLHDAPEYVIGDMISPFKAVLGGEYKAVERRLQGAIHLRFGLPGELPAGVLKLAKRADRVAAFFEATRLAGFTASEAQRYFGRPAATGGGEALCAPFMAPWPTAQAEARFLSRFETLLEAVTAGGETDTVGRVEMEPPR